MPREKTLEQKLLGAAVVKMTFILRGDVETPMFKSLYPGILEDLGLRDEQVEAFIAANRDDVESKAKGALKLTQ